MSITGCGDHHSHPSASDHATHPPGQTQPTAAPESTLVTGADPAVAAKTLDPFDVKTDLVAGTVLPGGQSMLLVLRPLPVDSEASPRTDLVLFLLRTDEPSAAGSSWATTLVGISVREETLTFTDRGLDIASRGGTKRFAGFETTGDLVWNADGHFEVEVKRAVGQQSRVHREMSGVAAGPLMCAVNDLRSFALDPDDLRTRQTQRNVLNVGIRKPSEAVPTVEGKWNSVSLMGSMSRHTWELSKGRFVGTITADPSAPASEPITPPAPASEPITGSYNVGTHGEIAMTSDPPGGVEKYGSLDPNARAGIIVTDGTESFSSASFWWKDAAEDPPPVQAGHWAVFGRSASTDRAPHLLTGSVDIDESGAIDGKISPVGIESGFTLSGTLDSGSRPLGTLVIGIPVTFQPDTIPPAEKPREPRPSPPHDH